MNEILLELLEQTPVVISLGLGCFALWKDNKRKEDAFSKEREQHKAELKERNEYILERDKETLDTMKDYAVLLESVKEQLHKISNNGND